MSFNQALLKRLAILAVAALGGDADAATVVGTELGAVQPEVLTALLEPAEIDAFESRHRHRVLRVLALDPRESLRRRLADSLGRYRLQPGPDTEALLVVLAHDPSPVVQRTMAVQLGALLGRWPSLDRTQLIAEWALSDDVDLRLAVARALCRPVAALGAHAAVRLLSQDEDPWVRQAALSAARIRRIDLA